MQTIKIFTYSVFSIVAFCICILTISSIPRWLDFVIIYASRRENHNSGSKVHPGTLFHTSNYFITLSRQYVWGMNNFVVNLTLFQIIVIIIIVVKYRKRSYLIFFKICIFTSYKLFVYLFLIYFRSAFEWPIIDIIGIINYALEEFILFDMTLTIFIS